MLLIEQEDTTLSVAHGVEFWSFNELPLNCSTILAATISFHEILVISEDISFLLFSL